MDLGELLLKDVDHLTFDYNKMDKCLLTEIVANLEIRIRILKLLGTVENCQSQCLMIIMMKTQFTLISMINNLVDFLGQLIAFVF